jgi:LPXTG-motif cell wall-anchored protein
MTDMMKILYKKLYDIGKLMKIKDDYYLLIGINEEYKPDTIRIESVDSIAIKYIDVLDEELIFIINSNSSLKNTVYSFRLLKEMINSDFDSILNLPKTGGRTDELSFIGGIILILGGLFLLHRKFR